MIIPNRLYLTIFAAFYFCNSPLSAQLVSEMDAAYYMAIRGINHDSFNTVGVFGQGNTGVMGQTSTKYGYGVYGISTGTNASGVYGTASGGGYGVFGQAFGSTGGGVLGKTFANFNHGVIGITEGTFGSGVYAQGMSRGVTARASSTSGVAVDAYGTYIGVSSGASGGGFDFYATGYNTVDYGSTSSRRWKKNIVNIDEPLEKLSRLRGVYFDWDEEHGGSHDIGFIAEEVGEIVPEIVGYEKNGVDAIAMDYGRISPLLVEGINGLRAHYDGIFKRQQEEINNLKQQLSEIQSKLQSFKLD